MAEISEDIIALEEEETEEEDSGETFDLVVPILPKAVPTPRQGGTTTGKKIDGSPYRYEVVRMLTDHVPYRDIAQSLKTSYHFSVNDITIAQFKKNFYPYYKDAIERLDKRRNQHLITRIAEEMKEASHAAIQEVYEISAMFVVLDERIERMRDLPDGKMSAAYEGAIKENIKAKAALLQRMTLITGSSGMEEKLKEMVKRTALASQKCLLPYLKEDKRDDAIKLFEMELTELVDTIDTGIAVQRVNVV